MANYAIPLTRTASTTASVGNVTADATRPRRGKIYDILVGSDASPADNAFLWRFQRCTTAGTSTSVTPRPIDPGDAATEMDAGQNHSGEPTYTANSSLLLLPLNQRATFRWVASPGGELVFPATASNGIGVETPSSSAVAVEATLHVAEQ